jgi:hypothetical protein
MSVLGNLQESNDVLLVALPGSVCFLYEELASKDPRGSLIEKWMDLLLSQIDNAELSVALSALEQLSSLATQIEALHRISPVTSNPKID